MTLKGRHQAQQLLRHKKGHIILYQTEISIFFFFHFLFFILILRFLPQLMGKNLSYSCEHVLSNSVTKSSVIFAFPGTILFRFCGFILNTYNMEE